MKNKQKRWKNGVILIPVLCVLLLTGCGLFQEEKSSCGIWILQYSAMKKFRRS